MIGIVSIDNSEEIFKICGDYVGKYLISIPEGEIKYDENFSYQVRICDAKMSV